MIYQLRFFPRISGAGGGDPLAGGGGGGSSPSAPDIKNFGGLPYQWNGQAWVPVTVRMPIKPGSQPVFDAAGRVQDVLTYEDVPVWMLGGSGGGGGGGGSSGVGWAQLAESQRQFDLEYAMDQKRWQEQLRENAAKRALAQREFTFLQDKFAFESSMDRKADARATQQMIIDQQVKMQQLDFQRQEMQMAQQAQQQRAMEFQQRLQYERDRDAAQLRFQREQAQRQAEQDRRAEQRQLATDIGTLAQDAGDRGRLAAFLQANQGFGAASGALPSMITDQSLSPLESLLRQQQQLAQPQGQQGGFAFSGGPSSESVDQAGYTPEQLAEIEQRIAQGTNDLVFSILSGNPNRPGRGGYDEQLLNQYGVQTVRQRLDDLARRPGSAIQENGGWYSAAPGTPGSKQGFQGAMGGWYSAAPGTPGSKPVIQSRAMPMQQAEHGGLFKGAFVAGDDSEGKENREVVIPLAEGVALVIPEDRMKGAKKGHDMPEMQEGGLFAGGSIFRNLGIDENRSLSRNFIGDATTRAVAGTPWQGQNLPGAIAVASPGQDPMVAQLLASINALAKGVPYDFTMRQASLLRPAGMQERAIGRTA